MSSPEDASAPTGRSLGAPAQPFGGPQRIGLVSPRSALWRRLITHNVKDGFVLKAWQFREIGSMPVLTDVDEPTAAPGDVVIDVKAAGLCHTDVGIVEGVTTAMLSHWPIVLGHEAAGVVSAVGPDVTDFAVGDRVGIVAGTDGPGVNRDGAYAEKTSGPVASVVRIPDNVTFVQAAAGADAGLTSVHAIRVTGAVVAGMKVGIIGLGGLGMTGAQIAVLQGAEVWAAEPNTTVHQAALDRGVTKCVTSTDELAELRPDVIIDFAGMGTTDPAIQAVKVGGTVVQVGVGRAEASIVLPILVAKMVHLVGNNAGTAEDYAYYLDLVSKGDLDPLTSETTFDGIGAGLELVQQGKVKGRLVAVVGD